MRSRAVLLLRVSAKFSCSMFSATTSSFSSPAEVLKLQERSKTAKLSMLQPSRPRAASLGVVVEGEHVLVHIWEVHIKSPPLHHPPPKIFPEILGGSLHASRFWIGI